VRDAALPPLLPPRHAAEEIGDALTKRLAPILAAAKLTPDTLVEIEVVARVPA
jgi:hypothetical protein